MPKTVPIKESWHFPEQKELDSAVIDLPSDYTREQAMEVRSKLIHALNVWAKGSFAYGDETTII